MTASWWRGQVTQWRGTDLGPSGCPNGQCPDGPATCHLCPRGSRPNGQRPNGPGPNGQRPNGHGPNGQPSNGQRPNGHGPNGQRPNGQRPNGHGPNGQRPNGHGPNGQRPNEHGLRGRRPGGPPSCVPCPDEPRVCAEPGGTATVCMTRSRPRVQGPRVVSDWSSTSCSDSGLRRGPPAPGPTQPAGETAHQPDAAGVVPPVSFGAGSLPRAPFAPAFPGSFSGWRPILPYYEDASQKDHGSSSDSSWAAPPQGAGHCQACANPSARPVESGTQTDYDRLFGPLPLRSPSRASLRSMVGQRGYEAGSPQSQGGAKSYTGTRSGVDVSSGSCLREPTCLPRRSSDLTVYQDCTGELVSSGGLEWDDGALRTIGKPWVTTGGRLDTMAYRGDMQRESTGSFLVAGAGPRRQEAHRRATQPVFSPRNVRFSAEDLSISRRGILGRQVPENCMWGDRLVTTIGP